MKIYDYNLEKKFNDELTDEERKMMIFENLKDNRKKLILEYISKRYTKDDVQREIALDGPISYRADRFDYEVTNHIEFIEYQIRILNYGLMSEVLIHQCLWTMKMMKIVRFVDKEYMGDGYTCSGFKLGWEHDGSIAIEFFRER